MRHGRKVKKLGRPKAARKALLDSLATSLFRHGRITTTVAKAKALRPVAERMITHAKKNTVHAKRLVFRAIRDREVLVKLFSEIAPKYQDRHGGYTRVLRVGNRLGDAAPTALIELV